MNSLEQVRKDAAPVRYLVKYALWIFAIAAIIKAVL